MSKLKKHYEYIKSLGVNIDTDTGVITNNFSGYDMPDYTSDRCLIPTSDKITYTSPRKMTPKLDLPKDKVISIAYNKGNYQLIDKEDLKNG
tara:strand:- start:2100 stop:2372 length:273 start_codon:yes stop_codon:yes gene_type:complete